MIYQSVIFYSCCRNGIIRSMHGVRILCRVSYKHHFLTLSVLNINTLANTRMSKKKSVFYTVYTLQEVRSQSCPSNTIKVSLKCSHLSGERTTSGQTGTGYVFLFISREVFLPVSSVAFFHAI